MASSNLDADVHPIDALLSAHGLRRTSAARLVLGWLLAHPDTSYTHAQLQAALAGKAPPVKIEGDVQLAAEIGWLADNLRWDVEEDLSRLIGDAPAHTLVSAARQMLAGLRQFLAQSPAAASALVPEPPKAFP